MKGIVVRQQGKKILDRNILSSVFLLINSLMKQSKIIIGLFMVGVLFIVIEEVSNYYTLRGYYNMGYIGSGPNSFWTDNDVFKFLSMDATIFLFYISLFFTIVTTLIYSRITNSLYINALLTNKYKVSGFNYSYFIIMFTYASVLWFILLISSQVLMGISFNKLTEGLSLQLINILALIRIYLFGLLVITFSILLTMWISSTNLEYTTKIIISVLFWMFIFFNFGGANYIFLYQINDIYYKLESNSNWVKENPIISIIKIAPGILLFILLPILTSYSIATLIFQPTTASVIFDPSMKSVWDYLWFNYSALIISLNIIILLIASILFMYLVNRNLRRRYE